MIQYTLAIDRSDEQVAQLYNPLHPAVLRLIQFAVEAAMRRGMPISVCGEMAGEPRFCALLLGLGLRNLSMAPRNIPRVKAAHSRPRHGRRHAPRPRDHGPVGYRPHRRPARRLQRGLLAALTGFSVAPESALTRLAALGTLSRSAGEGDPARQGWVGEGQPFQGGEREVAGLIPRWPDRQPP